jgi:hypothetical protein
VLRDLLGLVESRLLFLAAIASVGVLGIVGASAATLGGLRTNDLGATAGTVASHTLGISITWGSRWSGSALVLDSVTVTTAPSQPFVVGETIKGAIVNTAGTTLCTVTSTIATAGTSQTLTRTGIETACGLTPFAFSSIDRVALVVSK